MKAIASFLTVLAFLSAGCPRAYRSPVPPRVNSYRSPALARAGRCRVFVLPFRHVDRGASQGATEAFALELEKTQAFEVVTASCPEGKALEQVRLWENGGIDVGALTTLRRRFRIDAVALGQVTQYRPYDPPVLGLRVQMLSTRTGGVLWGAEGCFDAREAGVRALMQQFHEQRLDPSARQYEWKILFASPRHYAQFAAHQLVATLPPGGPAAAVASKPQ